MAREFRRLPSPTVLLLGLCVSALAGCGSASAAPAASSPALQQAAAAPTAVQDDDMVMVTLTDVGYRPSTIRMTQGRPTMFMVVNSSTKAQTMSASIPVNGMSVQNADGSGWADPPSKTRSGFDVTIPPQTEVDFAVTPTATGSYPLTVTGAFGGDLSVQK